MVDRPCLSNKRGSRRKALNILHTTLYNVLRVSADHQILEIYLNKHPNMLGNSFIV
jgi:hypothetical protein